MMKKDSDWLPSYVYGGPIFTLTYAPTALVRAWPAGNGRSARIRGA
jgi:hypothetical protein